MNARIETAENFPVIPLDRVGPSLGAILLTLNKEGKVYATDFTNHENALQIRRLIGGMGLFMTTPGNTPEFVCILEQIAPAVMHEAVKELIKASEEDGGQVGVYKTPTSLGNLVDDPETLSEFWVQRFDDHHEFEQIGLEISDQTTG